TTRPDTSAWAAIGGVPAGLALIRRDHAAGLDRPSTDGCVAWEQAGRRIQFRDAMLCRLDTVADYHRANLRAPAPRRAVRMPPDQLRDRPEVMRPKPERPAVIAIRNGLMAKFDYLVAQHLVTREQLVEAPAEARRRQISVETVLLEHHGVREADLAAAL